MQDLTVILPKQTRLKDAFAPIMAQANIQFIREKPRHAYGVCVDGRGEMAVMSAAERKPDDALRKLKDGKADLAVMGADKFIEAKSKAQFEGRSFPLSAVAAFNCAACRMFVAAKPEQDIQKAKDLDGMTIATSFPYSLRAWLAAEGVSNVEIVECDGDTEDEIRDGSADAIFEIVDSGRSLVENGLETKILAYNIETVMVASSALMLSANAQAACALIDRLTGKDAVKKAAPVFTPKSNVNELCFA